MRTAIVTAVTLTLTTIAPAMSEPVPVRNVFRVPYVSTFTVETVEPELCVASWYGGGEHLNVHTANGDVFDPEALTVAAWDLPFGTVLEVSGNGSSVRVTVNDRGPARRLGRCLDLSRAAFERLAPLEVGLLDVSYRVVRGVR